MSHDLTVDEKTSLFQKLDSVDTAVHWNESEFPKHGVKVKFFCDFIENCGGKEALTGKTTTEVCEEFVKPATLKAQASLCDLLRHCNHDAYGEKASVFISHAWRYNFLEVVSALQFQFREEVDTVVWFDLYSNNQHKACGLKYEWWEETFKSAIADMKHTIMVLSPWNDPIPYTRAWCIFEAYCTAVTDSKFEIAMGEKEQDGFLSELFKEGNAAVDRMLGTIRAEKAESFKKADKDMIFAVISRTVGFLRINSMLFEQYRDWVIEIARNDFQKKKMKNGKSDPLTLTSQTILARLYALQGKHAEAQVLDEECFELRKSTLGKNHPDTILSANNLAMVYMELGLSTKAQPLFEECLLLSREIFGEKHHSNFVTMNNLAWLYQEELKYDKAQIMFEECLNLSISLSGDTSPDTIRTLNNLAIIHGRQGNEKKCQQLHEECYRRRKETLGDNHPDTLQSMNNLGWSLKLLGEDSKALPLLEESYARIKTILGTDHPYTLACMHNVALYHRDVGDNEQALPLLKEYLSVKEKALGNSHPEVLTCVSRLGNIYLDLSDYAKAEPLLQNCLDLTRKTMGESHSNTHPH